MANRHGLVAGATGTGKTVTLQVLAEAFSRAGVPVFAADIKGDLSGISQPGGGNAKVDERIAQLGLAAWAFAGSPVDVLGRLRRAGASRPHDRSPRSGRCCSRACSRLNDIQEAVLTVAFRVADDNGLLLLDLERPALHAASTSPTTRPRSAPRTATSPPASIGAIQRNAARARGAGRDKFFGEPALDLFDFIQTDAQGRGYVNILAADKLMMSPQVYSTLLLWLLSELFERLPEVGDVAKPKLVFFFDEAHLLFNDDRRRRC